MARWADGDVGGHFPATGHVPQEQIRTPAGYPPCPAPQGSREARKTPWKPPRGGDGPEGLGENRSRAHEDAPLPSRQSPWDGPTGAGDRRRSSPGAWRTAAPHPTRARPPFPHVYVSGKPGGKSGPSRGREAATNSRRTCEAECEAGAAASVT